MPPKGRFSQWPPAPETTPLERISQIRSRYPLSKAPAPPVEAQQWTEENLERYFASDGLFRPRKGGDRAVPKLAVERMRDAANRCPLLVELRTILAKAKINEPPPEYTSFCRHVAAETCRLPVAEVTTVPRVERALEASRMPLVLEPREKWPPWKWDLAYWKAEYSNEVWQCFRRYPESRYPESEAADRHGVRIGEFVDYIHVLEDLDPRCLEEYAMAFPRFTVAGWRPFAGTSSGRKLWEEDWVSRRQLWSPPCVVDLTPRWVNKACETLGHARWDSMLAGFDRVQLAPAGSVTCLHVDSSSAHTWYGQMDGQSVFFLFSPEQGSYLYGKGGCSPVDIFSPSDKHTKFTQASAMATLLEPGEILLVPSGWWVYSAALEPSAVLCRRFWNRANKEGIMEEFKTMLLEQELGPGMEKLYRARLEQVRELLAEDDGSDTEA